MKIFGNLRIIKTYQKHVLENIDFWDQDLTKIKKLKTAIAIALEEIDANGVEKGFANFSNNIKNKTIDIAW